MNKIIDLSMDIYPGMPVYPGDPGMVTETELMSTLPCTFFPMEQTPPGLIFRASSARRSF